MIRALVLGVVAVGIPFATHAAETETPPRADVPPARAEWTGVEPSAPVPRGNIDAAARLIDRIEDPSLRSLIEEALARNPHLRVLEAEVRAARHRVERVGGLPDPTAMVTAYVEPPETRVGAQRLMASVTQPFPWNRKRSVAKEAESHRATSMAADLEAARLDVVTRVRRLYHELGFVDEQIEITHEFRRHLERHEEIARSRYGTGRGSGQGVLKLQAEISRADRMLLDLDSRRVELVERLNALLDRAAGSPIEPIRLAVVDRVEVDLDLLVEIADRNRPELEAVEARIEGAEGDLELARLRFRPDFMVGLTYGLVEDRDDPAGRAAPPPDNGQDVFGVQAGVSIPLWRKQRRAGLEEALERRRANELARLRVATGISTTLADLTQRLDLTWRELRLLDDLLIVQARESVESAQAAYVAGQVNALDLFDAEHVLFDTRTAIARSRADYLITLAELEGAAGAPIEEQEDAS